MTTTTPLTAHPTSAAASASTLPSKAGPEVSIRAAAVLAGVSYVVLFALAFFANFFVREGLVISDDATATAANLAESENLFRLGMLSFIVIFVLDIVVSWALYIVFRSAHRDLSLVAAWSRLIYTVFLGVAVIFFFQGMQLLSGAEFLDAFDTGQLQAQALIALETFNSTWLIGLVAFGLHLGILGYLVVRTGAAPKILGYVLVVAGAAYVIDTTAHTLMANYADYRTAFTVMVAVPAVVAEGWFGLWLLLRAGRQPTDEGQTAGGI